MPKREGPLLRIMAFSAHDHIQKRWDPPFLDHELPKIIRAVGLLVGRGGGLWLPRRGGLLLLAPDGSRRAIIDQGDIGLVNKSTFVSVDRLTPMRAILCHADLCAARYDGDHGCALLAFSAHIDRVARARRHQPLSAESRRGCGSFRPP